MVQWCVTRIGNRSFGIRGRVSASPAVALAVSVGEREMLERLARSHAAPHRQVMRERVRVLLMAADGLANTRIAEEVGVTHR